MKTPVLVLALGLVLISSGLPAFGSEISLPAPDTNETRIDWIRTQMGHAYDETLVWKQTWAMILGTITVGQLVPLAYLTNSRDRLPYWFGAGASVVGLIGFLLQPIGVLEERPKLEALLSQPESGQDDLYRLREAERMLAVSAQSQRQMRGWVAHTANVLYNVAGALTLGFGFHRWTAAATFAGPGIAIGEVVILTQPGRLIRASADRQNRVSFWLTYPAAGIRLIF